MEQTDSLNSSMQQLMAMQQQQISILSNMSSNQAQQLTLAQQKSNQSSVQTAPNFQPSQQQNFYPSSYMNYAPNSMEATFPTSAASRQQSQQFGAAKSAISASNKYGFIDSIYPDQDRVSNQARTAVAMDYGSRLSQGVATGLGAVATGVTSVAASAILPGIAGIAGGFLAGAPIGAFVNNGINEMKKDSAYNQYFARESYKFVNPTNSENNRDIAGFSLKQGQEATKDMREMSVDNYMKDDEMMSLTQKLTDGGMLKDTKNVKDFKEKMQSLVKNVKTGALMLNETYDSIADLLSTMKKAGIDQKDFDKMIAEGKVLGSYTGTSGSAMTRDLLGNTITNNAGTGNSNTTGYSRATDTALYTESWYQSLDDNKNRTPKEDISYNLIKNLGGSTETAKAIETSMGTIADNSTFSSPALTFFDYNDKSKQFTLNQDKFDQFLSGSASYQQLQDASSSKLSQLTDSGNSGAVLDWTQNGSSYLKNSLSNGDLTKMLTKTVHSYANSNGISDANLNFDQVLGMMGVTDNSTRNVVGGYMQYREQKGDSYGKQVNLQSLWETQNAETRSATPSVKEKIGSWWDKTKQTLGKPFAWMQDSIDEAIVGTSDKIYGFDESIGDKPDKYYNLESNLSSFSSADVKKEFDKSTNTIAAVSNKIEGLSSKGYDIGSKLTDFLKDTVSKATESVSYTRDVIDKDSWKGIDKSVSKYKGTITDSANKNDLSETILGALVKYSQTSGIKTTNDSIKAMADKLGNLTFDYGGNKDLALAAYAGGSSGKQTIDNKLTDMGYNVTDMRSKGQQSILQGVNIDDVGVSDKTKKTVKKIEGTSISTITTAGTPGTKGTAGTPAIAAYTGNYTNKDLRQDSGVSVADLDKLIADKTKDKPDSMMLGQGQAFYDAGKASGVDALYLVSHAGEESGWGTSSIAKSKGNLFGIGAFDSSPAASAYSFGGDLTSSLTAQANWIKSNYLDKGQSTLTTMENSGHQYATDAQWTNNISSVMKAEMDKIGAIGVAATAGTPGTPGTPATTVVNGVTTHTVEVNRDKSGKNINPQGTDYVAPPINLDNSKSINDASTITDMYKTLTVSNDSYQAAHDKLSNEVINSGDKVFGYNVDKSHASNLYAHYQDALDRENMAKKAGIDKTNSDAMDTMKRATEAALNKFQLFQDDRSNGKYTELKDLEDNYGQIQSDKAGAGDSKMSSYQESLILKKLGEQQGIQESDYKDLGSYNSAVIKNAQDIYNTGYQRLQNFTQNNGDPTKMDANGKAWASTDITDKASTLEILEVLKDLKTILPGLKGNISDLGVSSTNNVKLSDIQPKNTSPLASGVRPGETVFEADARQKKREEPVKLLETTKAPAGASVFNPFGSAKPAVEPSKSGALDKYSLAAPATTKPVLSATESNIINRFLLTDTITKKSDTVKAAELKAAEEKKVSIFTVDEQKQVQHLFKNKDEKGKDSGGTYYDPYNVSKEQVTVKEYSDWVKDGSTVDYMSVARAKVNDGKKAGSKLSSNATYSQIVDETKKSYATVSKQNFDFAAQLNAKTDDLAKNGNDKGFSNEEIAAITTAVNNQDSSAINKLKGATIKGSNNDPDVREANKQITTKNAAIAEFSTLVDKMKGLKTKDFQTILDSIDNMKKVSSDVGKGGMLLDGLLGKDTGKVDFENMIKSAVAPALKGFNADEILKALQNGGKAIDKNGKTVNIAAKDMETLTAKISDGMAKAVKGQLQSGEEGRNGIADAATKLGGKNAKDIETNVGLLNQVVKDEEGKKGKALDELKSAQAAYESKITTLVLADLLKANTSADTATTNANNLGSEFEKYDASIASAMAVMKNRIDTGWSTSAPQVTVTQQSNGNTNIGSPTSSGYSLHIK